MLCRSLSKKLSVRSYRWAHEFHEKGLRCQPPSPGDLLLPAHRVKDDAATTWVRPKLVAEVKFTEWTSAGEMRHPAYLGLREDKRPEDVVRETESPRKPRTKRGTS